MNPARLLRAGRIVAVVAVVLFFAAVAGAEVERNGRQSGRSSERSRPAVVKLVKAPVLVMKHVAVTGAKLENHVSSSFLHTGVDLFTRTIHWFSRHARTKPPAAPGLPSKL